MGLRPIVLLKSPYIMRLALYLYRILPTNFSNEPYICFAKWVSCPLSAGDIVFQLFNHILLVGNNRLDQVTD